MEYVPVEQVSRDALVFSCDDDVCGRQSVHLLREVGLTARVVGADASRGFKAEAVPVVSIGHVSAVLDPGVWVLAVVVVAAIAVQAGFVALLWRAERLLHVIGVGSVLCALAFGSSQARAQQCITLSYSAVGVNAAGNQVTGWNCTNLPSAQACVSQMITNVEADFPGFSVNGGVTSDPGVSGPWTGNGTMTNPDNNIAITINGTITASVSDLACPTSMCAMQPAQPLLATAAQSTGYTNAHGYCVGGCEYTSGGNTLTIGGGNNRLADQAVPTGNTCGATDVAATGGSNCAIIGGVSQCASSSTGKAVIGTDAVTPAAPPALGTCIGYADGAAACNPGTLSVVPTVGIPSPSPSMATPPGPDNGTPGQPATPTAQVAQGMNLVNFYGPAVVAASAGAVGTKGTGNGTASGTTVGAPGAGGAYPGDCNQSTTDASGCAGALPSLTRTDTVQSDLQAFDAGLNSTPLMAAINNIQTGAGINAGTCPSETFTSVTLAGHTFDFLASACQVFSTDLPTLQAISDVAWALLGVLIIVSA
jgi:hypothetical protein